jgi:hypothetical protein
MSPAPALSTALLTRIPSGSSFGQAILGPMVPCAALTCAPVIEGGSPVARCCRRRGIGAGARAGRRAVASAPELLRETLLGLGVDELTGQAPRRSVRRATGAWRGRRCSSAASGRSRVLRARLPRAPLATFGDALGRLRGVFTLVLAEQHHLRAVRPAAQHPRLLVAR